MSVDRDYFRWARRGRLLLRATGVFALAVALVVALVLFADEGRRADLMQVRDASLALLQVGGILLILFLAAGLVAWLSQPIGITFENATGDQQLDGSVLAQSLVGELQRIEAAHAAQAMRLRWWRARTVSLEPPVLSRLENLAASIRTPLAPSGRSDPVAAIGTLEVAGASLPLGSVLVAVKQLWPLPKAGPTITGRLASHGEVLAMTVRIRRTGKAAAREFTVTAPPGDDLMAAAASRIAYELTPRDLRPSPAGFGHLTYTLGRYHEFQQSQDPETLRAAADAAVAIPDADDRTHHVRGVVYNLGVCCLRAGELERAERLLMRARRSDSSCAIICNAVGSLQFEQRRFVEAKQTFQLATRLKPSPMWSRSAARNHDVVSWNGLGNAYVELADYVSAIDAYRNAIRRHARVPAPHCGLANAYLQQHQWEDARREYRTTIRIEHRSAHARYGLGNLEARRGHYEEALVLYLKALDLDERFAEASNGLGEAYAALGRYEEAVLAHQRALALRPDDPYTLCSLGDTYRQQGELERAREVLEQAREIDDSAAYVWRNLGRLHLALDDAAGAARDFEEAVRRNPRDAAAWEAAPRPRGYWTTVRSSG
jgi:tetratricopeptide (TPR) repeat protein